MTIAQQIGKIVKNIFLIQLWKKQRKHTKK